MSQSKEYKNSREIYKALVEKREDDSIQLLNKTNNVNYDIKYEDDFTLAHVACQQGFTEFMTVLIAEKPNLSSKTKTGWTPLHFAVAAQSKELVELLLGQSPSVVNVTESNGLAPIHIASRYNSKEIVNLLADKCQLSVKTNNGNTAEDIAEMYENTEVLDLLKMRRIGRFNGHISRGEIQLADRLNNGKHFDINQPDKHGSRAVDYACSNGQPESLEYLIGKGANICLNTVPSGLTALQRAAQKGKIIIVKMLCERYSVDVNEQQASTGLTALHFAAHENQVDIVRYLLNKQGAALMNTAKGTSVLQLAKNKNSVETVEFLQNCNDSPPPYQEKI